MKTRIIREFGFRWKILRAKSKKNGNYVESVKIGRIRRKNIVSDSRVS